MPNLPRRLLSTTVTRLAAGAVVAIVAVLAAILVPPSPASAAAGTINCVGTTQITFQPGLTYQERPVHATETTHFGPCASTEPGIISGMNIEEYTADWSCLTLLHTSSATYPIHWNNGTSSTVSINYAVTSTGAVVTSEGHGSVVDGVLTGATVTAVWTYAQPNALQCLSSQGLTEQIGPVTLTITAAQ